MTTNDHMAALLSNEVRKRIANVVYKDCTLIPDATFYTAAEMAVNATLAQVALAQPQQPAGEPVAWMTPTGITSTSTDYLRGLTGMNGPFTPLYAHPSQQEECKTCGGRGMIGGPSYYAPDEGGVPCPDCCPSQQEDGPTDDDIIDLLAEFSERHDIEHGVAHYTKWNLLDAGRELLKRYGSQQEDDARDGARLDWLEARTRDSGYATSFKREADIVDGRRGGPDWTVVGVGVGSGPWAQSHRGYGVRAAIDAAMSAAQGDAAQGGGNAA